MFIRTRIQSRKAPQMSKLASMTAEEAAKYGPYGKNDRPCTIDCYGKRTEWKSRRAAIFFFTVAAKMCEGSEAERYQRIADILAEGATVANDGTPVIRPLNEPLPPNPEVKLAAMIAKRDTLAKALDELRDKGCYEAAQRYADDWNAVSVEIIRLTKAMREKGLLYPLQ